MGLPSTFATDTPMHGKFTKTKTYGFFECFHQTLVLILRAQRPVLVVRQLAGKFGPDSAK